MSQSTSSTFVHVVIGASYFLMCGAAWSHAGLVRSEPGRRAVLTASPEKVKLCFNEKVEPKFSAVSVTAKSGMAVSVGPPAAESDNPNCLVTPITATLAAGSYTVKYRVLSVDGHIVDYGFEFTVRNP